jgi:hypothetical protein
MPFRGTSAHERRNTFAAFESDTILKDAASVSASKKPLENRCPTSLHVLVSATLKLSRITRIPSERKVFRGLGKMQLGPEWFSPDKRGARAGVELGFMSTTLSRDVALEYSGVKLAGVGTILEFDVGAIDCGAQLGSLSQYPGLKWSLLWEFSKISGCLQHI